ncbi:hypothetical protein MWN33_09975 [Starkeya koreensis]|uniref:Uncharacterized protein n=1 Tax=Ancylobacter koreensis TaxID=266121 RepID=A0ABT0DM41_9HYPH|nr:hypothetical protein [Ancylobacter koreensis]MCK0208358.1 hypothetical protein [Ancylobacter koreensis]
MNVHAPIDADNGTMARATQSELAAIASRVRSAIRLAKLALDDGQDRSDAWNLIDDALAFAVEEAQRMEDTAFKGL